MIQAELTQLPVLPTVLPWFHHTSFKLRFRIHPALQYRQSEQRKVPEEMNSGCDVVLCWRGTLYWPCLCSRFRNRSPQFAALHLSSIMQDNHTNTVQATRKACISERGLRTAPSSISLCLPWDVWQGFASVIYWSTHSRSWHRDLWEMRNLHSLQFNLILVTVYVTGRIVWRRLTETKSLTLKKPGKALF